jgi:dTDP-4-dehydrorhamnose reductase
MVFDGKRGNYRESDTVNPLGFYAQTKVQCEEKIAKMNFNSVVVRVALTYGIGIISFNTFFEKMISNIKSNSVALFVDQFRTPILVNNLAEAILELAENEFTGIINLSGGERMSRWDFGLLSCKILSLPTNNLIKSSMFDFPASEV